MGSRAEPCLAPAPPQDLGRGALMSVVAPSDLQPPDLTSLPSQALRVFSDEAARAALAALGGPYLPWSSGAMRPAGLVAVCNDIVLNGRRRVVELGSGVSTVLLARLLTQRPPHDGFRMAAVEHDPGWARWVSDQLDRERIGGDVVVIHAPLLDHALAERGMQWYDEAAVAAGLDAALRGGLIDLLLVDGPPAYAAGHGLARYPALPALHDRLAPGATVILDDVERPGEKEVLRRWERETGLEFHRRAEHAGVAVARISGDNLLAGPHQG
jgi:predicted O-methyltransferase YrrM